MRISFHLFIALVSLCFPTALFAQAPGVTIFEQSPKGLDREEDKIHEQVTVLVEAKKHLSLAEIKAQIKAPKGRPLELPPAAKETLSPVKVAERAKQSLYRVGSVYLCGSCDQWHAELGAGYAITADGVLATCAHVIEPLDGVAQQTLIAVDMSGRVFPVTSILANDVVMDAAIVKIDTKTVAIALNDVVRPGDEAFCLSRPLDQRGYFSRGIVNRFYWEKLKRGGDDRNVKALGYLRLNVSTPWAPGSSGAPVLDTFGNVIGHVSEIAPMNDEFIEGEDQDIDEAFVPLITLHIAIPARSVRALAVSTGKEK